MSNEKKVLENIHNLVTWHYGQNYLFNACMQYLMECLGESQEYDYWFFSGVTGDSFTQLHRQDPNEWTACLSHDTFDYDFAKKAFDACGYNFTYVDDTELKANKAKYVQKVIEYIDKGIPVLSKGCEGTGEFSVICGYENGGEAFLYLKGDDKAPTPYKSDFTCHLGLPTGLVFAGEKKQAPPLADVYRKAVMSIPSYITMPPENGLTFGKQAFDDWADSFLDDRFKGKSDKELDVWKIHGTYLCISGTNGCSREFLRKAQTLCPDMEIIPHLLPIYEKMQNHWEELQHMEGGFGIPVQTLTDKGKMLPVANKIRELGKCCDEILEVFASYGVRPKAQRIETPRLIIRRWAAEDWPAFQSLAIDYNATGGKHEGMWSASEADCRKSVEFMATDGKFFAVCLCDTGEMIGMLVLNGMDSSGEMDLGYIFHTRFQDAGHDREALEAMIAHIFTAKNASSIVVRWQPSWTQQFVAPKALGFEFVGDNKGEMRLTRNQWEQSV